ncbi:hypothetical protein ACTXT7_001945 [Hymenolepis weldensis]
MGIRFYPLGYLLTAAPHTRAPSPCTSTALALQFLPICLHSPPPVPPTNPLGHCSLGHIERHRECTTPWLRCLGSRGAQLQPLPLPHHPTAYSSAVGGVPRHSVSFPHPTPLALMTSVRIPTASTRPQLGALSLRRLQPRWESL